MKKHLMSAAMLALGLLSSGAKADTYGPYPEETYLSCGDPKSPIAIELIHGGWLLYFSADAPTIRIACEYLGRKGFYVMAVNYRLATTPAKAWPAAWQDAQMGIRFLRQTHRSVGVVGISAGGYSALGMALKGLTINWAPTDPRDEADQLSQYSSEPDFTVAISPFSDLSDTGLWQGAVRLITAGETRSGLPQTAADLIASPLSMVRSDSNPLLVIHGAADPVVPVAESRNLVSVLQYAGADVTYIENKNGHGFAGMTPTQVKVTFDRIAKFARWHKL